jgi:uncharacterized protein (DUF427 family)
MTTLKAIWNNQVIAESDDTLVVEGNHYFPAESVKREFLLDSDKTSHCFWKGTANYHSIEVNGQVNSDAAWYYAEPLEAAENIRGKVAFWRGVQVTD